MKKFDKRFKHGTRVKIVGSDSFYKIQTIHETRQWITLVGLVGSFQRGHISTFNNKEVA